jgi:hypothetical protein
MGFDSLNPSYAGPRGSRVPLTRFALDDQNHAVVLMPALVAASTSCFSFATKTWIARDGARP